MSRFIESIKVQDGRIFLLDYHQRRVNATFSEYLKEKKLSLSEVIRQVEISKKGLFKLRIEYDLDGSFEVDAQSYRPVCIDSFSLIELPCVDYHLKFSDRTIFQNLKKNPTSEVIITQHGLVTDTTFSNLIFFDGHRWVTPDTFLLNGVQRQYLVDTKKVEETSIHMSDLPRFHSFKLINAMNDFESAFSYSMDKIIFH